MTVQVSCASEEGSGTPVPALSIEVDDIEPPWRESKMQAFQSSMVQKVSLGKYEDSMSEIRFLMISRGIDYLQLKSSIIIIGIGLIVLAGVYSITSLNPKALNNIPKLKRKEQSIGDILLEWIKEQLQVQHRGKSKVAQIAEANLSGEGVKEGNGQHKAAKCIRPSNTKG